MQDIVLYKDAKQAAETMLFAQSFGAEDLIILFSAHAKENDEAYEALRGLAKAKLRKGLLVKDAREAQKNAQRYDIIIGLATRENAESKHVTILFGAETLEDKDKTHRRGSGMNQVIAKLLAEKKKTYAFDLSTLFSGDQATIMGRMQQNKRILRKYGVQMTCCSFATRPLRVRAPKEREHFLRLL